MKDYRLSEIKERCKKQIYCTDCEFFKVICDGGKFYAADWDIEPRDMIELPCKIPMIAINEQVLSWQVAYRSVLGTGDIRTRLFDTEAEADEFLARLKGGKQ